MKKLIILFVLIGVTIGTLKSNTQESKSKETPVISDEHDHAEEDEHGHGHGGGKAVGPGKAILEVSEEKGFKLSKEAFQTLDVRVKVIEQESIQISKDILVSYQNKTGIYRYRNEFFKFIPVTIKEQKKDQYLVHSPLLQSGDKIVTSPVGLIRITDVYSTDTAEYGHSH